MAIAFAREGADVAISYLPEEQEDADDTARWITEAGAKALPLAGDLREEAFCAEIVERTVRSSAGLDLLVLNAAYQRDREGIENLETEEFDRVFRTNLYAQIFTARAAVPHLAARLVDHRDVLDPGVRPLALADRLRHDQGRAGRVRQGARGGAGPARHPRQRRRPRPDLDAAHPRDGVGRREARVVRSDTPLGRPGQPAELAGAYVYLASEAASYVSGAVLPVTGGKGL